MAEDIPLLPPALGRRLTELFPTARVRAVRPLHPDADPTQEESSKQTGYGRPLYIELTQADGTVSRVVLHTATSNDFGHDRRADRAAAMLLGYDTFPLIPRHVRALDVGTITAHRTLVSLSGTQEFYLVTEWADGHIYAEDLRRVAREGMARPLDIARVEALAGYLADLHQRPGTHDGAYTRAIRDLVGHGEGVAGIVDGYPDDTPGAAPQRLQRIEQACLQWRFRLRRQVHRLRRIHGDFHPFNLLFDDHTALTVLDTSRGSEGDPADDVACLSINFLFFGLQNPKGWATGLGRL